MTDRSITATTKDLHNQIMEAREFADKGGVPARRKDSVLYDLLAKCLAITETVQRDNLKDELAKELAVQVKGQGNSGAGRRYTETKSDEYIIVCRCVLEGQDNRNSIYRYAATLREAGRRQIQSDKLVDWLRKNGGINTLFQERSVAHRTRYSKILRLNEAVEIPADGTFSVSLKRNSRNFFDVLSYTINHEPAE